MTSKFINQSRKRSAEKEADKLFSEFEELIIQTYSVRKHGYLWETLNTLDKENPDYKEAKDKHIDNSIIQASMCEAIPLICESALALMDHGSIKKRVKYFKSAIIYCETIKAYEHVYTMAAIALKKDREREYFEHYLNKYRGVKNKDQDVILDIDELLNRLNEV